MASLNHDKISKVIRECIRRMIKTSLNENFENILISISMDEPQLFNFMMNIYLTCNLIHIYLMKAQNNQIL